MMHMKIIRLKFRHLLYIILIYVDTMHIHRFTCAKTTFNFNVHIINLFNNSSFSSSLL
jgi:hypothetical protein